MTADLFTVVQDGLMSVATSPFALLALFALCCVDGFFPPVPSETLVIALATTSAAGQGAPLLSVLLVASVGAFTGDLIAYGIGRALPAHKVPLFRSGRGKTALDWAHAQLNRRGGSVILAARYIPIGRVAVNITAGSTGYRLRTFVLFATLAALSWGTLLSMIGLGAGAILRDSPLLASGIGIVAGLTIGWAVDALLRMRSARRLI